MLKRITEAEKYLRPFWRVGKDGKGYFYATDGLVKAFENALSDARNRERERVREAVSKIKPMENPEDWTKEDCWSKAKYDALAAIDSLSETK